MRISDKKLGYIALAALFLLAVGISFQMWNKQRNARDTAYVRFQELGSLQPEDAVTIRGFRVGKITRVTWDKEGALVSISLESPRIFRTGTVFRNENYSLMGQRRLAIDPSKEGDITPPEYIFTGEFEPGIAEALHLMDLVKQQVILVRDVAKLLQHGDSTTPSLPQVMEKILGQGEQLADQVDATLQSSQPKIASTLNQAQQLAHQTIRISNQADSTVRALHSQATLTIQEAHALIANLRTTLGRLDQILAQIESHPLTGQLLYERELVNQIESLVATLRTVLSKVDRQGIVILDEKGERKSMVKLRNINLFGQTAHEKAADKK